MNSLMGFVYVPTAGCENARIAQFYDVALNLFKYILIGL